MKALKKHFAKIVLVLLLSALGGVAYFDTYPTHFKQTGTLSEAGCYTVATIVTASAYKNQNPDAQIPEKAKEILDKAPRLEKRVAKYILDKNPEINKMPPPYVFTQILNSCLSAGGEFDLVP